MPRWGHPPRLAAPDVPVLERAMKRVLLTFAASWFLIATVVASAFAGG